MITFHTISNELSLASGEACVVGAWICRDVRVLDIFPQQSETATKQNVLNKFLLWKAAINRLPVISPFVSSQNFGNMDPFPLSVSARVTTFYRASPRLNLSSVFSCGESYHYIWISIMIASSCASDFAHWIFLSRQHFPCSQIFQIANLSFSVRKNWSAWAYFLLGVLRPCRHRKMRSRLEMRPFFCLREINASMHNSASLTNYLDF